VAAGFTLLAVLADAEGYWTSVFPGLAVLALGAGIAVAPLTDAVLEAVDDEFEGAAAGVSNAVARVAALLAVAAVGFALGGDADPSSAAARSSVAAGYRTAMLACAVASVGSAVIAALTIRRTRKVKRA